MKRISVAITGFFLVAVLCAASAFANDPPHDASNGIKCINCHSSQQTLGLTGYNNICLNCHRPGMARGGRKPFTPEDAANPFKTFTTSYGGVSYQNSHNWSGSDFVPAAGALPPLSAELNSSQAVGKLTCSRCHDPHSQQSSPFLRMANDRDQMCLDCHRVRDTRDHTTGSHPVNFNYTSATSLLKLKPLEFNNPPLNANPANPSSALQLKAGTVLCTTCHGVHYTDSNSQTFDGYSGYKKLTPSAGYILRTDLKGKSAADNNICRNCHIKQNHNGRNQNVQCADCHGAHVDVADGSVPNTFLVRRYMNVSSAAGAVRGAKVMFQDGAVASGNYKDASGTGVCQGCHAVPTGPSYPTEHTLVTAKASDCNGCHSHANPTGSFSAAAGGCSGCHGYPPRANHAGGPDGYAAGYASSAAFKDESLTPHATHAGQAPNAYACGQCHQGNRHASGTFQDLFLDKTGLVAGASAGYDAASSTCSLVYCHSNGAPRGGSISYQSVTWANGKGKLVGSAGECAGCHEARPTTNAHGKHLSRGFACNVCHAATVSSDTVILDASQHADGIKTVAFGTANPLTASAAWIDSAATCIGGKCHSDGRGGAPAVTPNWLSAATGACGSCHAAAPATLSHSAHFSGSYGPQLGSAVSACQSCHVYTSETAATHVNGTVDLNSGAGSACANCHAGSAPVWGSGRLACTSCHALNAAKLPNGVSAPYKPNFASSGHGQFSAAGNCTSCHDQNAAHISGSLGVNMRLSLANDNNLCASCHNNSALVTTPARQNMVSHVTAKGGLPTSDCKSCHDVHGTANLNMVKTVINGVSISFSNPSSGFVKLTAPYNGLCQVCHSATNHYKAGQVPDGHPTKYCTACHSHQGAVAFKPAGSCDTCHGYPPAPAGFAGTSGNYSSAKLENYAGGSGAHLIAGHVKPGARPSEGWLNCSRCHSHGSLSPATHTMILPVTPSKITVDVDDAYRFNPALHTGPKWYSGVLVDNGANATGSCSNVKCHFKSSKKWSTAK
jgi:predicted CxxxxCH...CXXCH cytochrome family protein